MKVLLAGVMRSFVGVVAASIDRVLVRSFVVLCLVAATVPANQAPVAAAAMVLPSPLISSSDYPCVSDQGGTWSGGIGVPGVVTFQPNGASDLTAYLWSLEQSVPYNLLEPAADGTATMTIIPPRDGSVRLYVQSINGSGEVSEIAVCEMWVLPAINLAAWWRLDEISGAEVTDSAPGGEYPGVASRGVSWVAGRVMNAARFDGKRGHVSTDGPVIYTGGSFSVSAWVRLSNGSGTRTVVSQDGDLSSGFYLQYRSDLGGWAFSMRTADSTDGELSSAVASSPVQFGTWVHLVGVYDAQAAELRIFVDGLHNGTAYWVKAWAAGGAMQIGRGKTAGSAAEFWAGDIDEVQVIQRPLADSEVYQLYLQYG